MIKAFPSSVVVMNIERIPLTLYAPGGLAVAVFFVGGCRSCEACPWGANADEKSSRVIRLDPQSLASRIRRLKPDIVFFHGSEPYTYSDLSALVESLRGLGIDVGMKVNATLLKAHSEHVERIRGLGFSAVLVEDRATEFRTVLDVARELRKIVPHVEAALVVTNDSELEHLQRAARESYDEELRELPISIVIAEEQRSDLYPEEASEGFEEEKPRVSLGAVLKTIDVLRSFYPYTCAPEFSVSDVASTLCPQCRTYVVVRQSGVVIKLNVVDGKCKYCSKSIAYKSPRRVYNFEVNEPVI